CIPSSSATSSGVIHNRAAATTRPEQRRARHLCQPNYPRPQKRCPVRDCDSEMKRFLLAFLFFAVLIALWEWAFRAKIWSPVLLPALQKVAEYLKTAATDGTLFQATVITMSRLLIGYVIGLMGGLPLGLLTARW